MSALQSKLRQLRSWQHKTLLQTARDAEMEVKQLAKLEAHYPLEAYVEPTRTAYDKLATAYGLTTHALKTILGFAYGQAKREAIYRSSLPEVARQFFASGNFVVLDLETTSANPHREDAEIVDIAIVDEDGLPLLTTLVKPTLAIPEETTKIHGITDEIVKDAPSFCTVVPKIVQAIQNKTILIFNADYDGYLLDNLFNRNGLDMPYYETWCLMRAYADYRKRPGKYKGKYAWIGLQEACQLEKVEATDAHRALGDTLATYGLLKALAGKE